MLVSAFASRSAFVGVLLVTTAAVSFAVAQNTRDTRPSFSTPTSDATLPPGWTTNDMQKFNDARTPGPMHQKLSSSVGNWNAAVTFWPSPNSQPSMGSGTMNCTPILDGRFVRREFSSDCPSFGQFNGYGVYGFDNVTGEFQGSWIDNFGTGIANGTGELSSDGKTLSWAFPQNCPLTGKSITVREVERLIDENTKTVTVFTTCPKSGHEFKSMEIRFTRIGAAPSPR